MTESGIGSPRSLPLPHPALFAALIYPFGAVSGYLGIVLVYNLGASGVSAEAVSGLIALTFIPNTWGFLWAPLLDAVLGPRRWYVLATVLTAATIVAVSLVPVNAANLGLLSGLAVVASFAATLVSMACSALAVRSAPSHEKGRFGGWLQCGNLVGGNIGGGAALWVSQHVGSAVLTAAALALSMLVSPLALMLLRGGGAPVERAPFLRECRAILKSCVVLLRSRGGALALFVLLLPLGTGAASGLWPAIAGEWHASADMVAWANGLCGGVASGIGCLVGGRICDRFDRKGSYVAFGVLLAACAVGMALAPRSAAMYATFVLIYAFILGLCYAGFSAVTLEVASKAAAATQYALLAALSNFPIQFMTLFDGRAHTRWGAGGMLYGEAAVGMAAALVYLVVQGVLRASRSIGQNRAPLRIASGPVEETGA